MTSWMAERDRLLAQADALSRTGVKTGPAPQPRTPPPAVSDKPHDRPLTPQPRPISAVPQASVRPPMSPAQPPKPPRAAAESEADHQPLTFRRHLRSEGQPAETLLIPRLASSERDDIEIRVTRFRELQTKLAMERQAYYDQQRTNIRAHLHKKTDD